MMEPSCRGSFHYNDVTMKAMASRISGVSIVDSTVGSGADQRNHQSPASLAFVRLIHRWPMNPPHKGPVTRETFSFDDVIMKRVHAMTPSYKGSFRSRALVLSRWIYAPEDGGELKAMMDRMMKGMPSVLVSHYRGKLLAQAQGQGLGRHSKEDVMMLAERDIRSLSTFLGKLFPFLITVRCRYNAVNFLQNIHERATNWKGEAFVGSDSDWYSAPLPAMIWAIPCYIGPRYNGNRL